MRDIKLRVEYENKADNTQVFTEILESKVRNEEDILRAVQMAARRYEGTLQREGNTFFVSTLRQIVVE